MSGVLTNVYFEDKIGIEREMGRIVKETDKIIEKTDRNVGRDLRVKRETEF